MSQPTSFRLPPDLMRRIDAEAAQRGTTMTRLVSSLLDEGLKAGRFPGVVYRDGPAGRRAALAGGPDVWEVVRAVRATPGRGEARVRRVARETEIPERLVRLAIEFAAAFPEEVDERIRLDEEAAERLREQVRARERLLGM
jgi:hypothetical protein